MMQTKTKFIQVKDLYFLLVIALLKVIDWVATPQLKNCVMYSIALAAYQGISRISSGSYTRAAHP